MSFGIQRVSGRDGGPPSRPRGALSTLFLPLPLGSRVCCIHIGRDTLELAKSPALQVSRVMVQGALQVASCNTKP